LDNVRAFSGRYLKGYQMQQQQRAPYVARLRAVLARPIPGSARRSYDCAVRYKEDASIVAAYVNGQPGVALYQAEQAAARMERAV
jgi:hypothetical protein